MIKTLLLDVDGVLVRGEPLKSHLITDYGIQPKQTEEFFSGVFLDCLAGKADLKRLIEPFLKTWGWKKSLDEFIHYWFYIEREADQELVDYVQTLRKKSIRCCLATNQEKYRLQYMLEHMGFKDSFDKIYASAHLGHIKPSEHFFKAVLEDLKPLKPNEILFWDDKVENVEAAEKLGISAELYEDFTTFHKKMNSYIKSEK